MASAPSGDGGHGKEKEKEKEKEGSWERELDSRTSRWRTKTRGRERFEEAGLEEEAEEEDDLSGIVSYDVMDYDEKKCKAAMKTCNKQDQMDVLQFRSVRLIPSSSLLSPPSSLLPSCSPSLASWCLAPPPSSLPPSACD